MKLDDFLEEVLPPQGNYFVEWNTWPGNIHHQKRVPDLAAASLLIRQKSQKGQDVWVAIGSFKNSRKAIDCVQKKALYIDVDAGADKPYDDAQAAFEALEQAVDQNHLPAPSITLESGNGVHVYWILDQPISVGDWRLLAGQLKAACKEAKLHVDVKVTTDPARIMRPPETLNYKDRQNPKPVRISPDHWHPELKYTYSSLALMLPSAAGDDTVLIGAKTTPTPAALASEVSVEDLTNGVDLGPFHDRLEPDRIKLAKQMLDCLRGKKYQSYDEWMRVGAALFDAAQGSANSDPAAWRDLWDGWSQENDQGKYDPVELDKKWAAEFPKYQGITVGSLIYLAKQNGFVFPNALREVSYPPGYIATEFGTIREPRENEDHPVLVMPTHLHDVDIRLDKERGFVYSAKVAHPLADRTTTLETSTTSFNGGSQAFGAELGCAGITLFSPKQQQEIIVFLESFREQIRNARGISDVVSTFGWCDRDQRVGFAAGRYVYWADGTRNEGVSAPAEMRERYSPTGSLGAWRDIVQPMLDMNRQPVNCAFASAFAAPLIPFTGISGMVLSLFSRDSGTGKSTALKAAQSVWGSPQGSINALDDTVNALVKRLEVLQNLPAYWDEVRMHDTAQAFVKMVFQLSQGKGKARLTSGAKLQHTGTWNTMIVVAGNESLHDHLDYLVNSTNAGMLRLLEVELTSVLEGEGLTKSMAALNGLNDAYGVAGALYAQWLAKNRDSAKKLVAQTMATFEKILDPVPEERFWLATISALYAGAYIADKQLNLVHLDLVQLRQYLVRIFGEHRVRAFTKTGVAPVKTLFTSFLQDQQSHSILTDRVAMGRGNPGLVEIRWPRMLTMIKHPLAYQRSDDGYLVVRVQALREWLRRSRSMTLSAVVKELQSMGAKRTYLTLASGTSESIGNREEVLVFELRKSALASLY